MFLFLGGAERARRRRRLGGAHWQQVPARRHRGQRRRGRRAGQGPGPSHWPPRPHPPAHTGAPARVVSCRHVLGAIQSRHSEPTWYALSKKGSRRRSCTTSSMPLHCAGVGSTPVGLCALRMCEQVRGSHARQAQVSGGRAAAAAALVQRRAAPHPQPRPLPTPLPPAHPPHPGPPHPTPLLRPRTMLVGARRRPAPWRAGSGVAPGSPEHAPPPGSTDTPSPPAPLPQTPGGGCPTRAPAGRWPACPAGMRGGVGRGRARWQLLWQDPAGLKRSKTLFDVTAQG